MAMDPADDKPVDDFPGPEALCEFDEHVLSLGAEFSALPRHFWAALPNTSVQTLLAVIQRTMSPHGRE